MKVFGKFHKLGSGYRFLHFLIKNRFFICLFIHFNKKLFIFYFLIVQKLLSCVEVMNKFSAKIASKAFIIKLLSLYSYGLLFIIFQISEVRNSLLQFLISLNGNESPNKFLNLDSWRSEIIKLTLYFSSILI